MIVSSVRQKGFVKKREREREKEQGGRGGGVRERERQVKHSWPLK